MRSHLEEEITWILFQVVIQEGVYGLQEAVEAEAHDYWVVRISFCDDSRELNSQVLVQKKLLRIIIKKTTVILG